MKKIIALVGTLDTKGPEINFVSKIINERGHEPFIIDIGELGDVKIPVMITRNEISRAGGSTLEKLIEKGDENESGMVMAKACNSSVLEMVEKGVLHIL